MWKKLKSLFDGKTTREKFTEERESDTTPWASFEVDGFEEDGRVKILFNWNKPFVDKIKSLGFQAETDEDTVQLFFYASSMKPMSLSVGDDPVQPDGMPNLTSQQNVLRTG